MNTEQTKPKLALVYVLLAVSILLNGVNLLTNRSDPTVPNTVYARQGDQGMPGPMGANGLDGKNGKDGVSIQGAPGQTGTIRQLLEPVVVQGTPGAAGIQGVKGDKGDDGKPGASPQVRVENCQLQVLYPGDEDWGNRGSVCEAKQ